jgi:threonine dehydrogenase-like Zn-dependent dehydrogenase
MTGIPAFTSDLFLPRYGAAASGDWELRIAGAVLAQGYWSPPVIAAGLPSLVRGKDVWMSVTPLEVESAEIGVRLARGHVLVMGLGMGWAAMATAMRDDVSAVTVVERDPDVLALHRTLDLFAQLPEAARAKLRIVEGDAYTYVPEAPVDLLMPDTWLPLVNDGRVDEVRRMQANAQADAIYFWGQELEIARHARAAGRALDAAGIAATIADFGLPLIGPEWPDYPELLATAANRWMRGRWLTAS